MSQLLSSPAMRTAFTRTSVCGLHYVPEPWRSPLIPARSHRADPAVGVPFTMQRNNTGTATASDGNSYTVPNWFPRFEWFDLDGDGVRESPALCCDDGVDREIVGWHVPNPATGAETWVLDFVEQGAAAAAGVLATCAGATGGSPLRQIKGNAGVYRATFTNGASVHSSAVAAPTIGAWVRLWCRWYADGSVQIAQAETTTGVLPAFTAGVTSSPLTPATQFGGGSTPVGYWLQQTIGGGANTRLLRWIAVPGILTADEALQRW